VGPLSGRADRRRRDGREDAVVDEFLAALEAGEVRAAEKTGDDVTTWEANEWVKRGILLNFGLRETEAREYGGVTYHDVLPLRDTADLGERGTRTRRTAPRSAGARTSAATAS